MNPLILGQSSFDPSMLEGLLLLLVKLIFLFGSGLYILFALIVLRQVYIMKNTITTNFSAIILTMAYLHFFASIGVALLFFSIL